MCMQALGTSTLEPLWGLQQQSVLHQQCSPQTMQLAAGCMRSVCAPAGTGLRLTRRPYTQCTGPPPTSTVRGTLPCCCWSAPSSSCSRSFCQSMQRALVGSGWNDRLLQPSPAAAQAGAHMRHTGAGTQDGARMRHTGTGTQGQAHRKHRGAGPAHSVGHAWDANRLLAALCLGCTPNPMEQSAPQKATCTATPHLHSWWVVQTARPETRPSCCCHTWCR
jgi:hypothetical protein